MNTGAFEQFFGTLDDPRQMAKVTHEFTDILFLVVCASKTWPNHAFHMWVLAVSFPASMLRIC